MVENYTNTTELPKQSERRHSVLVEVNPSVVDYAIFVNNKIHNATLLMEINNKNANITTTSHDLVRMKYGMLIESAIKCITAP